MLSSVEAWRVSLCAQPFDEAQGDIPTFLYITFTHLLKYLMIHKFKRESKFGQIGMNLFHQLTQVTFHIFVRFFYPDQTKSATL